MNTQFKPFFYCFAFLAIFSAQFSMAIETPKYQVTQTDGQIELRTYAPKIVAQTLVTASYEDAGGVGFRILADYIFGNNISHEMADGTKSSEKIAMTAPVSQQPFNYKPINQKSIHHKPLNQAFSQKKTKNKKQWHIQFVMPSKYTLQSLPKPNNDKVSLIQIPQKRYAVIGFAGFTGADKITKKENELLDWMKQNGINPISEPELARYDPPWTLPFMRRNEVLIEY